MNEHELVSALFGGLIGVVFWQLGGLLLDRYRRRRVRVTFADMANNPHHQMLKAMKRKKAREGVSR